MGARDQCSARWRRRPSRATTRGSSRGRSGTPGNTNGRCSRAAIRAGLAAGGALCAAVGFVAGSGCGTWRLRGEVSSQGTSGFRLDCGSEDTRCGVWTGQRSISRRRGDGMDIHASRQPSGLVGCLPNQGLLTVGWRFSCPATRASCRTGAPARWCRAPQASSWFGEECRIHRLQAQGRPLVSSAADQGAGRAGFLAILGNQAQPQQLTQPCRDHQLALG